MRDNEETVRHPLSRRELKAFPDGRLALWLHETTVDYVRSPRFSWRRWRWRRAHSNATRILATRLKRDAEGHRGLCQRCRRTHASTHWAYHYGPALRFAHFCQQCAQDEAPGWLVVAQFERPQRVQK